MLLTSLLVASFIATALAAGEMEIKGFPTGDVKCGDAPTTIEIVYKKDAVEYFDKAADKTVEIFLKRDRTLRTNTPIVKLGTVQYPQTMFPIQWPAIFPAEWASAKDKDEHLYNDGKALAVVIEADSVDGKVTSYCGTFCSDKDFKLSCCPDMYPGCACVGDACNVPGVCTDGKCVAPTGQPGDLEGPCLAAEPKCTDAANHECFNDVCVKKRCTPGSKDCACMGGNNGVDGTCEAGSYCTTHGICKSGSAPAGSLQGKPCTGPGDTLSPMGQCGAANPDGTPGLLSCQQKDANGGMTCEPCTLGTADCGCTDVCPAEYICFGQRCVPQLGVQGKPCLRGTCVGNVANLVCVQNTCQVVQTPTPAPDPCAGKAGTENCPCAMDSAGNVGCTVKGLKCKNRQCVKAAGATTTPAIVAALALALLAMLF